jgi:hypothetical protein
MYEIVDDDKDGGILSIICTTPSCSIPLDPANLDYQKVLDDIIEQGADCFEGDIPTELQTAADAKQFAQQLESYTTAIARLAQYVIADGRTEVVESLPTGEQVWNEETEQLDDLIADAITVTAIDPVDGTIEQTTNDEDGLSITTTIENPLITQDNAERAEAQAVVDTTPQAVIDTYNGE